MICFSLMNVFVLFCFLMTLSRSAVCPGGRTLPCNGHGVCNSGTQGTGTCFCSTGWTGPSCSTCDHGYEGPDCSGTNTPYLADLKNIFILPFSVPPPALPVGVSDVIPWWGFLILFGGVFIIIVVALILWRQKRVVEHKVQLTPHPFPFSSSCCNPSLSSPPLPFPLFSFLQYTSLLRNQPIEMGDDSKDNQINLEDDEIDEDENDVADRNW